MNTKQIDNRVWSTTNILVLSEGKVLLMRRAHTKWMDGYLGLPGGHILPFESPRVGAARELREELGLAITPARLEFLSVYPRVKHDDIETEKVAFEFIVHVEADEVP